jgi:MFS family permease
MQWIAFSVCSWCVVVLFQCLCTNYAGLLVCRILLGTFEGLFGTGIVYYLSLWYRRDEMGLRVFWFLGPTAIAGAFGGLIAFGCGKIASDIPRWKILFLIEGLPGFCLGVFCLYWLPDRPLKNSRFTKEQNVIAKARYYHEAFDKAGGMTWRHVRWTATDWKLYAQGM